MSISQRLASLFDIKYYIQSLTDSLQGKDKVILPDVISTEFHFFHISFIYDLINS